MTEPTHIIFGPQGPFPEPKLLEAIRQSLLTNPYLLQLRETIKSLPDLWPAIVDAEPSLSRTPGLQVLEDMSRWIDTGILYPAEDSYPNILLTPLTIITHLWQYLHQAGITKDSVPASLPKTHVQGFCTGFLAATAVSCSRTVEELSTFACVILRLSVCLGALVDLDGKFAEPSRNTSCLVVNWKPLDGEPKFSKILDEYPDAYISAKTDTQTATVTIAKSSAEAFRQRLSDAGLLFKFLELEGRFHSARHEKACMSLINSPLLNSREDLKLPDAKDLILPLRSNLDGRLVTEGRLHEVVLKAVLVERCNWYLTLAEITSNVLQIEDCKVLVLGKDCFPRDLARRHGIEIRLWTADVDVNKSKAAIQGPPGNAIAIVGMACRFPGANTLEEFWDLLAAGESKISRVPLVRFSTQGLRRSPDPETQYWGNFIEDAEAFDNKFFKKSSREASQMDPQQRLALSVAYEAMESCGHFDENRRPSSVGVYLGVGSVDYQDNVGSHMPNAFSALGTLRAFISGKISHYFGWTGPSITYDTACSSSAVAIHSACKAIQSGECKVALAGGVNVMTSPALFQNLGQASFLSPTGASKSFDALADGYCRGEGCGLVVLKKFSQVTAQDEVLAVITGSAINQNENSSPITVPHTESQSSLYRQVVKQSGMDAHSVTYVEAHGTGTPVGDPIEAASIRQVFGGFDRAEKLWLGSVKGNIGHLEAASGAAALIKSVLMIQKASIPPQASFVSLNPKIPPLSPDKIEISTKCQPWKSNFRSVCINNYGAAGSNAAMIVCQPPRSPHSRSRGSFAQTQKHLFLASAHTLGSLRTFCAALQRMIIESGKTMTASQECSWLANMAFNLAHKHNHNHQYRFVATATNASDLWSQLDDTNKGPSKSLVSIQTPSLPVILSFGGQISSKVGLSRAIYDNVAILKVYLDECDVVCKSLGTTIFPYIFDKEPIADIVSLHCSLFALQYSCAKAWIESGVPIAAVIGHSFGQLTALCVAGILSLHDALKFIAGRASLIRNHWGPERGAMISVKASLKTVEKVIALRHGVEIACRNGPGAFVLVGSTPAIDAVEIILSDPMSPLGVVPAKRLSVTHGFHSAFVDAILPGLWDVAKELKFNEPTIPIETCSPGKTWTTYTPELIVAHFRDAVFFEDAVRRIERRLGPCIWLEAGSDSSITKMARNTLERPKSEPPHSFVPLQLNTMESVLDATVALRRSGVNAHYWPYHNIQRQQYTNINLPPYQFEKTRHWLDYKDFLNEGKVPRAPPAEVPFEGFMRLINMEDSRELVAEFEINTMSRTFKACADGHAVLENSLCPISLYFEIVATGIQILDPRKMSSTSLLKVEDLVVHAALGVDKARACRLILTRAWDGSRKWDFVLVSQSGSDGTSDQRKHATGTATVSEAEKPNLLFEKRRYQRLIGPQRCDALLNDPDAEVMKGPIVYRTFDRVVHYQDYYRGVKSVAAKNGEVAGLLTMPASASSVIENTVGNPLAVDNFLQVAGLHVNSLRPLGPNELFVCTSIRRCQVYGDLGQNEEKRQSWKVYSSFDIIDDKILENDIFVFDAETGSLDMAFWGVQFSKLQTTTFKRILSSINHGKEGQGEVRQIGKVLENSQIRIKARAPQIPDPIDTSRLPHKEAKIDVLRRVKMLMSNLTDTLSTEIEDNASFNELGIDSLMVTEVLVDIKKEFEVDIPLKRFQNLETISSLALYLQSKDQGALSIDSGYFSTESEKLRGSVGFNTPASVSSNSLSTSLAKVLAEHLELPDSIPLEFNLQDAGLDSLLSMEVQSDIMKEFGVTVVLDKDLSFGSLLDMIANVASAPKSSSRELKMIGVHNRTGNGTAIQAKDVPPGESESPAVIDPESISASFSALRRSFDIFALETHLTDFYTKVYPQQSRLVNSYIVEAFERLGCSLASLKPNERLSSISYKPMHRKLVAQIYKILESAGLVISRPSGYLRTEKEIEVIPSSALYTQIITNHPQHAFEHRLLNVSGPKLAECLVGSVDPLSLIFGSKANKDLLEDVYTHAPMFATGTLLLGKFLTNLFSRKKLSVRPVRILEIGAGTGGTSKAVLDVLSKEGIQFEYAFTDLSASLLSTAKRKFSQYSSVHFMILDIETQPPKQLLSKFDVILSTNCIHATKRLADSASNIRKMLRKDGVLCLIELTQNLPWFDLVFGLLDGWWRFEDGRSHALVDEVFWREQLMKAGFSHVDSTRGTSKESNQLQLIIASNSNIETAQSKESIRQRQKPVSPTSAMETVTYREEGSISLLADIYYPAAADEPGIKRPIALMIHGGGHIMLSRSDIRPAQMQLLSDHGFLPVSIDYRLCPEVGLVEGPMHDVCSALEWARDVLPSLTSNNPTIHADGDKVVAVGWSTGGQLAMSLAWTAGQRGIEPPNAILAFYCATDYNAEFWKKPNIPVGTEGIAGEDYNIWEGFADSPLTRYDVPVEKRPRGGWLSLSDPRSRIALHMNWAGQSLPVLMGKMKQAWEEGSNLESKPSFPQPSFNKILAISPRAQIERGTYRTPTFLIHGTADDLIPWQQTRETYQALVDNGIPAEVRIVDDAVHLFDLAGESNDENWRIVKAGYKFLQSWV